MEVLHVCPAKLATGGTEGIHNLVQALKMNGADAKILYTGKSDDPQPKQYKEYGCEYITEFPKDFDGCVIFPEVFANCILDTQYEKCRVAVNWQGVDVYYWNNPERLHNLFLYREDAIHIANSEYAVDHLYKLGIDAVKISDCLNDAYFQDFDGEFERCNTVLYNPTPIKLTDFQKIVMARCSTEYGIKFRPLIGYSQDELISIFRHSKLYIDFGVFSGRERLPREAVMCGCCILTSDKGTAGYYEDNAIPDQYKMNSIDGAIKSIRTILSNYDQFKADFDYYRNALRRDKANYLDEVRHLYEILSNNTCI